MKYKKIFAKKKVSKGNNTFWNLLIKGNEQVTVIRNKILRPIYIYLFKKKKKVKQFFSNATAAQTDSRWKNNHFPSASTSVYKVTKAINETQNANAYSIVVSPYRVGLIVVIAAGKTNARRKITRAFPDCRRD